MQIDQVLKLYREGDIRELLGRLPKSLESAYDEIYQRIQTQPGSAPAVAERTFQWLMYSKTPLSPSQLVAAVCQDPDSDGIINVDITLDYVLDACQNLVTVDPQKCRFSHLSVREYFESRHCGSSGTDCLIAKVCLSVLNNPELQQVDALSIDLKGQDHYIRLLTRYAQLNWVSHVQGCLKSSADQNLTLRFMKFLGSAKQSSEAYVSWHKAIMKFVGENEIQRSPIRLYAHLTPCSSTSLAVAVFGICDIIPDWWKSNLQVINQRNDKGESLLHLAALGGSTLAVQSLLEKGADTAAQCESLGSVLAAAAYYGRASVIKLLLEAGCDVNYKGGYHGTALNAASHCGDLAVMRMLIEYGAEVNLHGGYYGSALVAASVAGKIEAVKFLIANGGDVNAQVREWGNALYAASVCCPTDEAVKVLLDNGADVNAQGGWFGNSLQASCATGHYSRVKLLLEKGADVSAQGGYCGNALQAGCFRGRTAIVKLLLERGAKVNSRGGVYGNALQAAVVHGDPGLAKLLIDHGADVNARSSGYGCALRTASACDNEGIVNLLLERGAGLDTHESPRYHGQQ